MLFVPFFAFIADKKPQREINQVARTRPATAKAKFCSLSVKISLKSGSSLDIIMRMTAENRQRAEQCSFRTALDRRTWRDNGNDAGCKVQEIQASPDCARNQSLLHMGM